MILKVSSKKADLHENIALCISLGCHKPQQIVARLTNLHEQFGYEEFCTALTRLLDLQILAWEKQNLVLSKSFLSQADSLNWDNFAELIQLLKIDLQKKVQPQYVLTEAQFLLALQSGMPHRKVPYFVYFGFMLACFALAIFSWVFVGTRDTQKLDVLLLTVFISAFPLFVCGAILLYIGIFTYKKQQLIRLEKNFAAQLDSKDTKICAQEIQQKLTELGFAQQNDIYFVGKMQESIQSGKSAKLPVSYKLALFCEGDVQEALEKSVDTVSQFCDNRAVYLPFINRCVFVFVTKPKFDTQDFEIAKNYLDFTLLAQYPNGGERTPILIPILLEQDKVYLKTTPIPYGVGQTFNKSLKFLQGLLF